MTMQASTAADTVSLIRHLADLRGLTGREDAVGEEAARLLSQYVPDAEYSNGSVTAHLRRGEPGAKRPVLLLCAHLDQVGFLVTDITDDGFLRIGAVGGIDRRILLGRPVSVHGKAGILPGVISILPPHLLKGEQAVPEESMLCVDLGFSSGEQVREFVRQGDAVYYAESCRELQNGLITGPALDDRCGVAALILAAQQLAQTPDLPCDVTFVFSGQEERGGRGAKLAALNEPADAAIAVDVTFANAADDSDDCYQLGGGPAIGVSPVLSEALSDMLLDAAERAGIPYQTEVMPGTTGTDADTLALASGGCAAGTVSIPERYMHTPVEVIAVSDVDRTAALLTEFAKEYGRA